MTPVTNPASTAITPKRRGYPPRDEFPRVRVGDVALTPKPAKAPSAEATTVERLGALLRPLPPRASGYFATIARRAYEQSAI